MIAQDSLGQGFGNEEVDQDLMATIVIEHIIQASDVAHDAALARLPKVEP
jgi:hypothetical protein